MTKKPDLASPPQEDDGWCMANLKKSHGSAKPSSRDKAKPTARKPKPNKSPAKAAPSFRPIPPPPRRSPPRRRTLSQTRRQHSTIDRRETARRRWHRNRPRPPARMERQTVTDTQRYGNGGRHRPHSQRSLHYSQGSRPLYRSHSVSCQRRRPRSQ